MIPIILILKSMAIFARPSGVQKSPLLPWQFNRLHGEARLARLTMKPLGFR
jgi:hypothetical protein